MITRNQVDAAVSMIETAAKEIVRVYNDGDCPDFKIEYERDDGEIVGVDSVLYKYESGDISNFSILENGDFIFTHTDGAGEGVFSIMCNLDTDVVRSYGDIGSREDQAIKNKVSVEDLTSEHANL